MPLKREAAQCRKCFWVQWIVTQLHTLFKSTVSNTLWAYLFHPVTHKYHRYIRMFTKTFLVKLVYTLLRYHSSCHFYIFCVFFSALHHRSGSTQTIFFCSSQMMVRRLVSREARSHQESGATLWYRHGSLSSSGSSLIEHASSCSSDWPWRWSFDLEV